MNSIFANAIVALSFPAICASSLFAEPDYSDIVAKHVTPAIEAGMIPGAVIGIYKDGEVSFYPIGTLNYDQDQAPTTETLYEIGSISKVVTGVFFADAVRRGEVTLDTLVDDLLPDGYKVQTKEGEDLKLWHLTTHTSGWGTAPANISPTDGERPLLGYSKEMMFDAINTMPLKQAPGEAFEYSNFAVGLLGTLIADNAEGEYESLVINRIIEPLGIENFIIDLTEDQQQHLAPATVSGQNTKAWGKSGSMDPCGMWVTNAPGLLKFAMASIYPKDGTHAGDVYQSVENSRETLYDIESGGNLCSGWFKSPDGSTFWHNGMTGGYSSYMAVNPKHDGAVVLLSNGAAIETTIIGEKIIQELFGIVSDPISTAPKVAVDDEELDKLIGVYNSATYGFDMTISEAQGNLLVQLTGQQPLALAALSEIRFKIKIVDAEIEFDVPEEGNATSVTLFQNGMEIKCERKD
tara:strand:- start:100548 stop:101939 length:1392 start_codon:yes stop_codon:yes gene_type:complete